jgi:hypothetical protein
MNIGAMTCNAFRFGLSTILLAISLPILPPDGPSGKDALLWSLSLHPSSSLIILSMPWFIEGGGEEEEEEEALSIDKEQEQSDQGEKDAKVSYALINSLSFDRIYKTLFISYL